MHRVHKLDDHADAQDTIEQVDDAELQAVEGPEEARELRGARPMLRHLRRIAVAFVGGIVVAVGVVMLVLPGPGILVIPAGLAILATEFQWARRLLHHLRKLIPKRTRIRENVTDQRPPKERQTSATI